MPPLGPARRILDCRPNFLHWRIDAPNGGTAVFDRPQAASILSILPEILSDAHCTCHHRRNDRRSHLRMDACGDREESWPQDRKEVGATIFGSDQIPLPIPAPDGRSNSTQHLRSKEQAVTRSHSPARFDVPGDEQHRRIVDAIHDHGWSEQDNFFPPDLTLALALECSALATAGTLTLALVGQGAARSLQPD